MRRSEAEDAHRLEQAQRAERVGVGRVLGGLEAHQHVRLGGQVVDLVGLGLLHDADQVGGVGQVAVVHEEAHAGLVRVVVEVVDAVGVEQAGAALDAVHHVALLEQVLGQVGAVLPGDAGDQCRLCHWLSPRARRTGRQAAPVLVTSAPRPRSAPAWATYHS